jgi:hypothetical protein
MDVEIVRIPDPKNPKGEWIKARVVERTPITIWVKDPEGKYIESGYTAVKVEIL